MPVLTTYICDVCSAHLSDKEQKFSFRISAEELHVSFPTYSNRNGVLCGKCTSRLGLKPYLPVAEQPPIETLIKSFITEEITSQLNSRQ